MAAVPPGGEGIERARYPGPQKPPSNSRDISRQQRVHFVRLQQCPTLRGGPASLCSVPTGHVQLDVRVGDENAGIPALALLVRVLDVRLGLDEAEAEVVPVCGGRWSGHGTGSGDRAEKDGRGSVRPALVHFVRYNSPKFGFACPFSCAIVVCVGCGEVPQDRLTALRPSAGSRATTSHVTKVPMKSALSRVFSAASARSTRSLGLVSQPVARVAVRGGQVRLQSTAPDAPPNDSLLALKNSIRAKDFASAWKDYTCVASNRALLRQFSQADAGKLITLIIRNPEQSNKLIADLKDIGVEWSTAEFNAVLEKEASTFIYGEAIAFLELMRRHSAQPNIDTYTILVKNLSKTDPVGAKAIVDNEEPADQVPPDGVIYPTLAAGFLRIGDVDVGLCCI